MTEHYKFFANRNCEYFPCHKVKNEDDFNCLFCYCPLYVLADECGGRFTYTDDGIKDCSKCLIPHSRDSFDHILSKYDRLLQMAKKK